MIIFQEQIERESIAVTLKASKITSNILLAAVKKAMGGIKNKYQKSQTPKGCQSVKKLMNHNAPTNTIPIEGDRGLFERLAEKWNIDYAFHKTGKNQYLLLFKTSQADAVTACFAEYSKCVMKRAKDKRPPVMDELAKAKKAAEHAERAKPKTKERTQKREVGRD